MASERKDVELERADNELLALDTILHEIEVARIRVGKRCRQDMGDLAALAKSIQAVGLLQPLVVRPDLQLVAGARRLAAVKELGWEKVPVHVVTELDDALAALRAEHDENTCRKDFTVGEKLAIAKALETLERAAAKQRKKEGGRTGGKASGKLPAASGAGDTRDKVAEAVGMSGRTYEKAKEVAEAAEAEPEKYGDLAQEMDRSGKVDPAHKKLRERGGTRAARRRQGKPEPRVPGAEAALNRLVTEGKVTWTDAYMVASLVAKREQRQLAAAGPDAVAAKARDLRWLAHVPHYYGEKAESFDPHAEVSDDARREALKRLDGELAWLRRLCDAVADWIAVLHEKLAAQDAGGPLGPTAASGAVEAGVLEGVLQFPRPRTGRRGGKATGDEPPQ
jgi:ParB family chromosome partitioning protein